MVFFSLSSALLDVFGITFLVYLVHFITTHEVHYTTTQLLLGALGVILFFIFKNAVNTYLTKLQATFAFSEAQQQSTRLFRNIFNQNELFFRNTETGQLLSDIMYIPNAFSNGIILGYITLITELTVLILMLCFLAFTSFYVSLLVLLFVAPAAFFSYRSIKNKIELLGNQRNVSVKQAQDTLIQSLNAHTDAIIYDKKNYFEKLFVLDQSQISAVDGSVYTLNSTPARLMELFAVISFCLIYIYSKFFGAENALPFNITLFAATAFRLLPSVNRSLSSMLRIKNHWFAVEGLTGYMKKEILEQPKTALHFSKNITLENIEFSFGDNTLCTIENFNLERGQCIGIYGNTGEGKSTFLLLLMQLIPPAKGTLKLDGVTVEKSMSSSYNKLFAYIKQDVFILNASLQENITLSPVADCDTMLLDEIIAKLELGKIKHLFTPFDSRAGEAGNNLSGGQKKLIALARALYFNKPILVLDEALSSLDQDTSELVLRVLKKEHQNGKTIIIVSHQKNVFDICDRVYEFKNGTLMNQP